MLGEIYPHTVVVRPGVDLSEVFDFMDTQQWSNRSEYLWLGTRRYYFADPAHAVLFHLSFDCE